MQRDNVLFEINEGTLAIPIEFAAWNLMKFSTLILMRFFHSDCRNNRIRLPALGFERVFHRLGTIEDDTQSTEVRFSAYFFTENVFQQISEG